MTIREEVVELLRNRSAALFGLDAEKKAALNAQTRFMEDLNCKSVSFVQLSAALEDEFEIEIPYQYISAWKTFGDAADYIATTLGE